MSVLPVGIGSEVGAGGYQIERSLRFNSADSAYLNRTPASAGNRKTWTWSGWVKPTGITNATGENLFATENGAATNTGQLFFNGSTRILELNSYASAAYQWRLITTQVFRDPSAWYHIVSAVDTTQATSSNRIKIYVNGVQVTAFSTATYPSQNLDGTYNLNEPHYIGAQNASSGRFNGYLTEVHFIDGSALDPTSFGEFNSDTGVWQPKAYTGSYGTNGFYLDFADNSGTTSTTLGADSSGNSNNWTPNNFSVTAGAGNDSLVDSPTRYGTDTGAGGEVRGNYATLNAVKPVTNSIAFSNGNLQYKPGSSWSTETYVEGTIGVIGGSTGKYYWEMSADQTGNLWTAGVALQNNTIGVSNIGTTGSVMVYDTSFRVNGSSTGSLTQLSVNEVLGIALDAATGKVWFRDSGGWLASGDPAAGTNEIGIPTGFSGAVLVPVTQANSASTVTANFGQRPFAYTAPSGFKALCTTNLPTPTIEDGGEYFNTVLWSGNATAGRSITGVGFAPDFVWEKVRSNAYPHFLANSVAGPTKYLNSNSTDAETTDSNYFTSFDSDGFTIGSSGGINGNGETFVGWAWKANGAGVTNTDGTITSTVSANTDAGFSIVTYTGTGANATVGHGLGVAPAMVIVKNRAISSDWLVQSSSLTSYAFALVLSGTNAQTSAANWWNSTAPTSTTFSIGDGSIAVSGNGNSHVAYCFAPVAGFSSMGSYVGNGSTDGPMVYTGFRPAFVMVKSSTSALSWEIRDDARSEYNEAVARLFPNLSNAESSGNAVDLLSNGFKIRAGGPGNWNSSGETYIYMAFASSPFQYSLAR